MTPAALETCSYAAHGPAIPLHAQYREIRGDPS